MLEKKQLILLIVMAVFSIKAQDTTNNKLRERKHEIGISVTAPFIIALGTTDYNERYSNLTYRYVTPKKHAFKLFTGIALFNNQYDIDKPAYPYPAAQTTIYPTSEKTTPSNFQIGVGYEYIMGRGKLKQVVGIDAVYNNKYERDNFYYLKVQDTTDLNGHNTQVSNKLDTGAYVHGSNFNKFGINLNYSLRYEFSKRWLATASLIMSYRTYRRRENNQSSSVSDFNMNGLISDISLFYRF